MAISRDTQKLLTNKPSGYVFHLYLVRHYHFICQLFLDFGHNLHSLLSSSSLRLFLFMSHPLNFHGSNYYLYVDPSQSHSPSSKHFPEFENRAQRCSTHFPLDIAQKHQLLTKVTSPLPPASKLTHLPWSPSQGTAGQARSLLGWKSDLSLQMEILSSLMLTVQTKTLK